MAVKVLCPNPDCDASYSVNEAQIGHVAHCKKCGKKFILSDDPSHGGSVPYAHLSDPLPPSSDLPSSFGPYQIVRKLGQGGMGAVYLAYDNRLDRSVALKVPNLSISSDHEILDRFQIEARAAAGFRHPNFCPIYDVGQVDGRHYLAMAYLEGKTLAKCVDRSHPLPQREAATIVRRLAIAMAEAHRKGILHRDLKPANIMVDERGDLILMDFGLARRFGTDDPGLTATGAILGTPHYMSPEQVRGDKVDMGPATDIYSLGVILYELLTGRKPFEGPMSLVLGQIVLGEPSRPSDFLPGLDPELETICLKAMAKGIHDRHVSMEAFAAALGSYLDRDNSGSVKPNLAPDSGVNHSTAVFPFSPRITEKTKPSKIGRLLVAAGLILLVGGAAVWAAMNPETVRQTIARLNPPSANANKSSSTIPPVPRGPNKKRPSSPKPPQVRFVAIRPPVEPGPNKRLAAPKLRSMPELIAPIQVYARASRGAVRLLALDSEGSPKPKLDADDAKARIPNKPREELASPATKPINRAVLDNIARKRNEDQAERSKNGPGAIMKSTRKYDPTKYQTELRGHRFVTIVGRIDHQALKALYATALNLDVADPHYVRLDVQRQEYKGLGAWGQWIPLNRAKAAETSLVFTDLVEEIVPHESRIASLVESLPVLETGRWFGADHTSLMPANGNDPQVNKKESQPVDQGRDIFGAFDTTDAESLMVRAIDFDAKPDAIYRYRLRIVVANPNYGIENNVAPAVDTSRRAVEGPWSTVTNEVAIPANVTVQAAGRAVSADGFYFEVAVWDEREGYTVIRKFECSPGQMIGHELFAKPPNANKWGITVSKPFNFTSRQILADAHSSNRPAADFQALGVSRIDDPMRAIVVRPDGTLMILDQAED